MKKQLLKTGIISLCFLFAMASKAQVIDFETLPAGNVGLVLNTGGYTFIAAQGGIAIDWDVLKITSDYASKALLNTNYGNGIILNREDNTPFNFASFDFAASPWEPSDVTVTGTFSNSTTQSQVVSAANMTYVNTVLNWTNLTKVYFEFAGGVNNAYGPIDNLSLSSGATALGNTKVSEFMAFVNNNTLQLNFSKELSNRPVTVFDAQGRQVLTFLVSGKTPSVNIQNLNKGMYIVKTENGTTRFIK